MEAEQKDRDSSDDAVVLRKPMASRPHLTLPPRPSLEMILRTSENFPSPMPLTPSFMSELDGDGKSFSFSSLLAGAMNSPSAQYGLEEKLGRSESETISYTDKQTFESSNELGLGGVMAPTARFKATPPSRLPIPKSSYATISPGLSPATLLDSPVLFASHQSEPSPTTGTFPLPPFMQGSFPRTSSLLDTSKVNTLEQSTTSNFVFKPAAKPGLQPSFPHLKGLTSLGMTHQQALAQVQGQARAQLQMHSQPQAKVNTETSIVPGPSVTSTTSAIAPMLLREAAAVLPIQTRAPDNTEKLHQTSSESRLSEDSKRGQFSATTVTRSGKPSHDGYNWRKYGQKQVKGSENPRSYYKCTHANCPMKKIVEQSLDGQITEIIYRGDHNHPRPEVTRRTAASSANSVPNGRDATSFSLNKTGGSKVGGADGAAFIESDQSSKLQEQSKALANGPSEVLSPSSSNDEASSKFSEDVDEDDPDAKRRKREKSPKDGLLVPRTIREPRVVVQTMSDVDILDDGYRWRKYGQKVVKGNPHPRSYYKCTNIGCPVRKHVERAPTDPNAVITTYEGKHNHDVPVARGSSHDNTGTALNANQCPIDVSAALTLSTSILQVQESSFPNVVGAPKTEDALEARTFSSLHYVDMGEMPSSDLKSRESGGNANFSAVSAFGATGLSSSSVVNSGAVGAGNFLGTLMPFSHPAPETSSMQLKQEQPDEYVTENPLNHQLTSASFHDLQGGKMLL